jgi:superfamily II DNA or RNA helicase
VAEGQEVILQPDTLQLRVRQQWAVHRLFEAFKAGHKRVLLVMPTGAGKRYIAVHLCQLAAENGRRVLFVTNRRLLVGQMFREAGRFGIEYGVMMSGELPNNSPIQIASVQTLESRAIYDSIGQATGHGLPLADLVIIDEGHQDVERYIQLLAFYPNAKVVILTATPVGAEGKSLTPAPYGYMIEGCLNTELIADGLLLPTQVFAPSEPNIEGVKIVKRQEYNQNQLGRAVQECTVFADVFNEWSPFADRKTVAFVPSVAFGQDLVRQFVARMGTDTATVIHAKTKPDDRQAAFDAVLEGRTKVLVSVDVLREGWDMPEISCMIDLQPNSQLRSYWQKIGRIKRAHEGQEFAVGLDFAGNYWRFPHPDTDPEWPVGDESTQDVIERRRKAKADAQPIMCPKCSFVRQRGPKCPQCGHEAGEPIRRIRMGNGKLRDISARAKQKVEKSAELKAFDKWKGLLFAGMKKEWSFGQCSRFYHDSTGEWPRDGWPGTFETGSLAWKRRVNENLTPRALMIHAKEIERGMSK